MYCTNCGTKLPEGAMFCAKCGTAAPKQTDLAQRPGITVDQHVDTNEGQVVGLTVGKGALQGGLNADVKQDIGVVKEGGAVVGTILGAEGPVHVGGQQSYGDTVHGPKTQVDTGGGTYIAGGVNTGGGDIVGRDKQVGGDEVRGDKISVGNVSGDGVAIGRNAQATVNEGIGGPELAALFAPIIQAAQSGPPGKREQAVQETQLLQVEVAKGKEANDETVAGLVESLVGLVPGAISAVCSAFGSPLLAGIAGPATSYVLKKLGLKR